MAAKVFLFHGMGLHEPGWAKPAIETIRGKLAQYGNAAGADVEFVELNYDGIFREYLQVHKDRLAGELGPVLNQIGGPAAITRLVDWAADPASTDGFFWTHALDVFLYRFTPLRRWIVPKLAADILEQVKDDQADWWGIVAHSLGTAVAHEMLHRWATEPVVEGVVMGKLIKPEIVIMLANVSAVLKLPGMHPHDSAVRPGMACHAFHSLDHELDPFSKPDRFGTPPWPAGDWSAQEVSYFLDPNIHSLEHYLAHPAATRPLVELATGLKPGAAAQWDADFAAAKKALKQQEVDALRNWLTAIVTGEPIFEDEAPALVARYGKLFGLPPLKLVPRP